MLVFLGDSISISVIFPFVPFLVQHFFQFGLEDQHQVCTLLSQLCANTRPNQSHAATIHAQIGYYAGMIASTYTIGQLISSGFWGSLSDRIGRRPVMLVCMVATMTCLAVFGLSKSFYCALAARFTQGLFSGNVVGTNIRTRRVLRLAPCSMRPSCPSLTIHFGARNTQWRSHTCRTSRIRQTSRWRSQ
jgi:MFS family permease